MKKIKMMAGQIEVLRARLYSFIIEEVPFDDKRMLKASRKLDKLLNRYQKLIDEAGKD